MLRADFHRPGGPRGAHDKAEADVEAERLARSRLLGEFPGWGFLGEETGSVPRAAGRPLWLVDPNDGTRDYLKGRRGSAVSIALLVDGLPRLGVVHAFAYPDDDGELFAWAEGCGPLRRNGHEPVAAPPRALGPEEVVLLSSASDDRPQASAECVSPARFRAVPSVAHRLALVAAGEAAAAVSLHGPCSWDYAAGHALLRAVGATLVDEAGREVAYSNDGESRCRWAFGGQLEVVRDLVGRPWQRIRSGPSGAASEAAPVRLRVGEAVSDAGQLARAHGCLLGQLAGGNLGALAEFLDGDSVALAETDGPRRLRDGGRWHILAGQPTDDSELALGLGRAIVARRRFDGEEVGRAYRRWFDSAPFDVDASVQAALSGRPLESSQANGSLMRASPLGIFGHTASPEAAANLARLEASLTHPHPVCGDAGAALVVAISHAIRHGDGASAAYQAAREWAAAAKAVAPVREALEAAPDQAPRCDGDTRGWAKIALQSAFHELLRAPSLEEGVVASVRRGGDTQTNAAVAGALLGAVHGRAGLPQQWRSMILSCRPLGPQARRARPCEYWPIDALELAERLLLAGRDQTAGG